MRLSSDYLSHTAPNVAKMASSDASRPVLTCLHLDVERKMIEATDTYGLVSIPVKIEDGDVSGLIPVEAWNAYFKAQKRRKVTATLQCHADEIIFEETYEGVRQTWKRPEGQFPNVTQLVPDESARSEFRVGIDAKKLARLQEALGADHVVLTFVRTADAPEEGEEVGYFPSNMKAILVNNGDHGEIGLLMPMRVRS